jgi:thiopurine S-methyltransferase
MEHSFWHDRWKTQKIGFHLNDTNPLLRKNFDQLQLKQGSTVLVPLCGKSLDIIYIKNAGFNVIGFELDESAVTAFFVENKLVYTVENNRNYLCFIADNITIYVGDFLIFPKDLLIDLDIAGVYDRAALAALPLEMRLKYYEKMISLYPKKTKVLCITFEYDDTHTSGPPFSIAPGEVQQFLQSDFNIVVLEEYKGDMDNPRLLKEGCTEMIEKVLLLDKTT